MIARSATEIKALLDREVIGQDRAKVTLAVAVAQHYAATEYAGDVRIKKANVLLLGPTGSGKTYLCETVARILDVPFAQTTASAISPAGWIGEHSEDVVIRMYQRAKQRYKSEAFRKARTGIVYIDEIDKLALRPGTPGGAQSASGDAKFNTVQIQQSLLRVVEGVEIQVDGNPLDTSGILFIASGAFVGLEEDIRRRVSGGKPFSRGLAPVNPLRDVLPQDLVAYGLIPEFTGRFPVVGVLDRLTEADLVAIMRDAGNSLIAQKRAMLSVTGCDLEVDELFLRLVARQALAQGTGARGIQAILEKKLEPWLFDLAPHTLVRMTETGVEKRSVPGVFSTDGARASSLAKASEPSAAEPVPLATESMAYEH